MVYKNFHEIATAAGLHPEYIKPFFNMVVENCAQIAEEQSRVYTGEHNEGAGCKDAANAIRHFGARND